MRLLGLNCTFADDVRPIIRSSDRADMLARGSYWQAKETVPGFTRPE
jgi:hypothetical protein